MEVEKVGGVVCATERHEIDHSWTLNAADWDRLGVKHHWLPVPDFYGVPKLEQLKQAVDFCRQFEGSGQRVYVHCKAGRSRSALIAAAYLIDVTLYPANEHFFVLKHSKIVTYLKNVMKRSHHNSFFYEFIVFHFQFTP